MLIGKKQRIRQKNIILHALNLGGERQFGRRQDEIVATESHLVHANLPIRDASLQSINDMPNWYNPYQQGLVVGCRGAGEHWRQLLTLRNVVVVSLSTTIHVSNQKLLTSVSFSGSNFGKCQRTTSPKCANYDRFIVEGK